MQPKLFKKGGSTGQRIHARLFLASFHSHTLQHSNFDDDMVKICESANSNLGVTVTATVTS